MSVKFKDVKKGDKILVKLNPQHNWVVYGLDHLLEPFEAIAVASVTIGAGEEPTLSWVGIEVAAAVINDGRGCAGYIHIEEDKDNIYHGEIVEILERAAAVLEEESEDEAD